MRRLETALARLLSQEWIGLAAGGALALGALASARRGASPLRVAAQAVLGGALASGAAAHLDRLAQAQRDHPPPGRRVALPGGRMHLLAEGEAGGRLPVVMFGGGHSAGLSIVHLHRALAQETRSILVDRFGTGWSDTGPFPRTTAREADEAVAALAAAGEVGPFVLVGYSFGGLLAANIARRRPDLVARLVLLDPTPLETLVFGPRLGAARAMRWDAFKTGLARLVGLDIDFNARRNRRRRDHGAGAFEQALGPEALAALRGANPTAGGRFADWSILAELEGEEIARRGWEMVVYDGDLGALELWLVAPGSAADAVSEPEVGGATASEQARMVRFYQRTRERYLAASSRARRIYAPEGSTHQFVYEAPDFVIEVLREAVRTPLEADP